MFISYCILLLCITHVFLIRHGGATVFSCVEQDPPSPITGTSCSCPQNATYVFDQVSVQYEVPYCYSFNTTSNLYYYLPNTSFPFYFSVDATLPDILAESYASSQCGLHCLGSTPCDDFIEAIDSAVDESSPFFYQTGISVATESDYYYYFMGSPPGYHNMSNFIAATYFPPCRSLSDTTVFEYNHHTGAFNQDNHRCHYYTNQIVATIMSSGNMSCTNTLSDLILQTSLSGMGATLWEPVGSMRIVPSGNSTLVEESYTYDCVVIKIVQSYTICSITINSTGSNVFVLSDVPVPLSGSLCPPGSNLTSDSVLVNSNGIYGLDEVTRNGILWHAGTVEMLPFDMVIDESQIAYNPILSSPTTKIISMGPVSDVNIYIPFPVCLNDCDDATKGAYVDIPGISYQTLPPMSSLVLRPISDRRRQVGGDYFSQYTVNDMQDGVYSSSQSFLNTLAGINAIQQSEFTTLLGTMSRISTSLLNSQYSQNNQAQEMIDELAISSFINSIRISLLFSLLPDSISPTSNSILKVGNSTYACSPFSCASGNPQLCLPSSVMFYIQGQDVYYAPNTAPPGTLPSIISSITGNSNFSTNAYNQINQQIQQANSFLANQTALIYQQLSNLQNDMNSYRNQSISFELEYQKWANYSASQISANSKANYDNHKGWSDASYSLRLGFGLGMGLGFPIMVILAAGFSVYFLRNRSVSRVGDHH